MKLNDIKNAYNREVLFGKLDCLICPNLTLSTDEIIKWERNAVASSCILIAGAGLATLEPILVCPIAIILGSYACIELEFNTNRQTAQYQKDKLFEKEFSEAFDDFETNSKYCTIQQMLNDKALGFKHDDFDLNDDALVNLMKKYDKFIYGYRSGIKDVTQFLKDKQAVKKELYANYLEEREHQYN